ncbi:glycoside hydrolase domain-containing protein, partial [Kibdelosporangium lantanae]
MVLFRLILRALPPYRSALVAVGLLQLGQTLAALLLPSLNADVVDNGVVPGDTGYILRTGVVMLVVTVIQAVCASGVVYLAARVAVGVGRDLRAGVFARVQSFSAEEIGRFGIPSLITRTTNDVQQVQVHTLMTLTMMVMAPIMGVGAVLLALRQDVPLSMVLLLAMVVLGVAIAFIVRRSRQWFRRMQEHIDDLNRILREQITGVRVIRAFVRDNHERQRFRAANEQLQDASLRVGRLMTLMLPTVMLVMNGASVAVLWFGGQRIDAGDMQVGALSAFLNYLTQVLVAIMMAMVMIMVMPRAEICAERITDVLSAETTVTPPNPLDSNVGRKGIDRSIFLGYTPTSVGEGMSWALEGYVNDFGISQMAQALYDKAAPNDPRRQEYKENAEYFRNRAQNYVTMFDPSVGFFQGKNDDGSWRWKPDQYDPRVWGYDYTETDGWNMAFTVPQDGQGLANLYGGRDKLAAKLDQFFATQETARFPGSYGGTIHEMIEARDVRMGQYGHSNQPSHHIPYMYDFTGQPAKTQAKVREITSRLYLGSEIGQGYPGDEDNGEMSAWYIFSALGFYPLQMGSANYAIGSPLFTKATINLENGRKLVVNAPKNNAKNIYVQGLKVNGKAYDRTFLPHSLLAA